MKISDFAGIGLSVKLCVDYERIRLIGTFGTKYSY
jgi:hypothetical protein